MGICLCVTTGSGDDRDELHLWNRQTVFCTVWTKTPYVAQQRACRKPCPRNAPVSSILSYGSMPAMKTGILGLRQQEEHSARDIGKNPSKPSLLVHTGHDAEHPGPEDREGNTARGTPSPAIPALQANHCRSRQRARPGREEVRGVRLFLLFFLFRLDEEDALLRRSSIAFMSARCCAHHGSLFASSRSAFSFSFSSFLSSCPQQHVGRGRRGAVPSTLSPPASTGTARRGTAPEERRTVRSLLCGPGLSETARPHPRRWCLLSP